MTQRRAPQIVQEELPLSSVASHARFPGRTTLYISEVASTLSISSQQVVDLILCGDLLAIDISASRTGAKESSAMTREERGRIPRTHWRVPVSAYDAFLHARKSV